MSAELFDLTVRAARFTEQLRQMERDLEAVFPTVTRERLEAELVRVRGLAHEALDMVEVAARNLSIVGVPAPATAEWLRRSRAAVDAVPSVPPVPLPWLLLVHSAGADDFWETPARGYWASGWPQATRGPWRRPKVAA